MKQIEQDVFNELVEAAKQYADNQYDFLVLVKRPISVDEDNELVYEPAFIFTDSRYLDIPNIIAVIDTSIIDEQWFEYTDNLNKQNIKSYVKSLEL